MQVSRSRQGELVFLGVACSLFLAACGSSGSGSNAASTGNCGPVTIGLVGTFSGTHSFVGPTMETGVKVAMDAISRSGGVLGCHHVNFVVQDDAADTGDAVPAAQKEISDGIVAFVGPTSATAAVVQPIADKANLPTLMFGGGSEFDHDADPRFYRMSASDSEQAVAMVYYARSRGWSRVALAFGNQNVDQALTPSVQLAAQKLGVKVTATVTFASGSTSFRSEIQT